MIGKRDKFWDSSEKQAAFELKWRRAADCYKGSFQTPETHDLKALKSYNNITSSTASKLPVIIP